MIGSQYLGEVLQCPREVGNAHDPYESDEGWNESWNYGWALAEENKLNLFTVY